uniref:Peptidase M15 n=1 Tax=Candidatus Kentrum sp. LPFa TaxID=2126335 RepID=A0A450W4U3_9GAMM|nr:MAG: Peptidase M15 [Candidatus Kentron sp. LPFa]
MQHIDLTPHFNLLEFVASSTALKSGIDNTPPKRVIKRLSRTAAGMEEVRALLGGKPITITSGYRCPTLNSHPMIGGKRRSGHTLGECADFIGPAYGSPTEIAYAIAESEIPFDKLIDEGRWVHIRFHAERARRLVFTALRDTGGRVIDYQAGLV